MVRWDEMSGLFEEGFDENFAVSESTRRETRDSYLEMLKTWTSCVARGGKILFFGNGGSASQAQHFATELVVRYCRDRAAIPAISLVSDASVLTACGNDLGFDQIFARQIEALGQPGDLAFGISTSGRSPNVNAALQTSGGRGLLTAALTGGDGGEMAKIADQVIIVPSYTTARIQEMHLILGHLLCAGIERALTLV